MKTKNLFLLLILFFASLIIPAGARAQYDNVEGILRFGDTTDAITPPVGAKHMFVAIADSSQGTPLTDTVAMYAKLGETTVLTAPMNSRDMNGTSTTALVPVMIATDGLTRAFDFDLNILPKKVPFEIRRTNVSTNNAYAPRTKYTIWFSY